jgi:hypothetical protein
VADVNESEQSSAGRRRTADAKLLDDSRSPTSESPKARDSGAARDSKPSGDSISFGDVWQQTDKVATVKAPNGADVVIDEEKLTVTIKHGGHTIEMKYDTLEQANKAATRGVCGKEILIDGKPWTSPTGRELNIEFGKDGSIGFAGSDKTGSLFRYNTTGQLTQIDYSCGEPRFRNDFRYENGELVRRVFHDKDGNLAAKPMDVPLTGPTVSAKYDGDRLVALTDARGDDWRVDPANPDKWQHRQYPRSEWASSEKVPSIGPSGEIAISDKAVKGANGLVSEVHHPNGTTHKFTHVDRRLTTVESPDKSIWKRDELGDVWRGPGGKVRNNLTVDENGTCKYEDSRGNRHREYADGTSRIEKTDGSWVTYAADGKMSKVQYLNGNSTDFKYDKDGQVAQVTTKDAQGRTKEFAYSGPAQMSVKDDGTVIIRNGAERTTIGPKGDAKHGYVLYDDEKNPLKSIRPESVVQGACRDCYLLAAISSMAGSDQGKQRLASMIEDKGDGNYLVTFPGKEPIPVKISPEDFKQPERDAAGERHSAGLSEPSVDGIWPMVLEKAYGQYLAKNSWLGSDSPTAQLDRGSISKEGVRLLTNSDTPAVWPIGTFTNSGLTEGSHKLTEVLDKGGPVTISGSRHGQEWHEVAVTGYRMGMDKDGNKTIFFTVRNQWGTDPAAEKQGNANGKFEMSLAELTQEFGAVTGILAYQYPKD